MRPLIRRLSVLLVIVTSALVVLQPLSVVAADPCAAERARVNQLLMDLAELKNELDVDRAKLTQAERDLENVMKDIDRVQATLVGEDERVKQELTSHGLWTLGKAGAKEAAIAIALALAGPEGWALLPHSVMGVLEVAEKAHTAKEIYDLMKEASEMGNAIGDLDSEGGDQADLRTYAEENGLTELAYMLDQEARLADLAKSYDAAWAAVQYAGKQVLFDQKLFDQKQQDLHDALEALYRCQDKAGPSPNPCEGQVTNPGGAGVCR